MSDLTVLLFVFIVYCIYDVVLTLISNNRNFNIETNFGRFYFKLETNEKDTPST